jgi:hypothetical protein
VVSRDPSETQSRWIPNDPRREFKEGSRLRTGARPERVYHESLSAEIIFFLLDKNLTEGPPKQTDSPKSARRISGFTATCVLISSVVGTGIFTTTGFMARDVGDPWIILALWGGGALLALTGAMCYSELGAAFPWVGGDYIYLREAYLWRRHCRRSHGICRLCPPTCSE